MLLYISLSDKYSCVPVFRIREDTLMSHVNYFQNENPLSKLRSKASKYARTKMYNTFIALADTTDVTSILDMGVSPEHTSPEANFLEKLYPYTQNITMSSIEDAKNLEQVFVGATFVQYNGGAFPFESKQFDICFSSAVLEHVGDRDRQAFFISECIRVAKKVYLTTPNRFFPIEMHTMLPLIHWLPQSLHQRLLSLLKMEHWSKTENLNLLTKKTLYSLIPEQYKGQCKIYYNRFLGIASNLVIVIDNTMF
jgi:hypothetical protein